MDQSERLTAYYGLYCQDCIPSDEELFTLARRQHQPQSGNGETVRHQRVGPQAGQALPVAGMTSRS